MKITEKRTILPDDVRKLCVEMGYYNAGTNVEYGCFLDTVNSIQNGHITNEMLYILAKDICKHTDIEDFGDMGETERIQSIMYDLARVSRTVFTVEK
ncbi:MAG: hypothetical protein PHI98_14850 [Eubacteriales bacterium]|nr:hypothetical protein [Eubacteriales bacterium]